MISTLDPQVIEILDAHQSAVVATAVGDLPSAAPVFYARDGDTLVFSSFLTTGTVEQLRVNPRVQVAIGMADGANVSGVQIAGCAKVIEDSKEIEAARRLILRVTSAFEQLMDAPVACYVRVRPTHVERVNLAANEILVHQELPANQPLPLIGGIGAMLRRLRLLLRAIRAPFFTASLVPIALGAALAVLDGATMSWTQLGWATLALLLAHAGTNLVNDYFDHRTRNDEKNINFTPVNGGSRMIQAGLWSPDRVLAVALLSFASSAAIGLTQLTLIPKDTVLLLGGIGIGLGIFYSGWPVRLAYHGLGDLAVAIGFGPLIVGGTYAVLAGEWSWMAALASVPIAIAVALILFINSFQDADADAEANKRTSIVRLGSKSRAFEVFTGAWVAIYLSIILLVLAGALPVWALVALLTAPLARWAVRTGRDRTEQIYELLPVNYATIGLHLAVGVLLAVGVVLEMVMGR